MHEASAHTSAARIPPASSNDGMAGSCCAKKDKDLSGVDALTNDSAKSGARVPQAKYGR
jgi:hypothetical protein